MPAAKREVTPDIIHLSMTVEEAWELACYLDDTDKHLGVSDRMKIAREIKRAIKN